MNRAYLIHERPFNDKRKYVLLFSKEHGITSTHTSTKTRLHYFNQYQLHVSRGNPKLQSPVEHHTLLTGKTLYCGLYLNELIYRFCRPGDAHPELFDSYAFSVSLLRQNIPLENTLRQFELSLLQACGYGIDTAHISEPYVYFSKHHGLVGTHEVSQHSISLADLNQLLHHMTPSPAVKNFLRHILNTLLPSSLQSSLFYEKVR